MKFLVFTHIPTRQGLFAPIGEKITLDECDKTDIKEVKDGCHVPLGGTVYIIPKDDVLILESQVVSKVVHMPTKKE